jgi:5-methylcytosine-specific restriction protein A
VAGRLKRSCAYPGCPEAVAGERYCERHRASGRRPETRPTRTQRGYDNRWLRLRQMHLRARPLCEVCEREGRVTPAQMVHHQQPIREGGHPLDAENLVSICRACHDRLHRRQQSTDI